MATPIGGLNLEGLDLSGLDLSGMDTSQLDLSGMDLSGLSFGPKPVDPNSISSGIGRGVDQMQQALYASVEVIGDQVGAAGLAKWGEEGRISNAEEAAKYGDPIRFKDADSASDYLSWFMTNTASGLAEMTPAIVGGIAGSIVPGAGTVAGATAGMAVSNLGNVAVRQKELEGEDAEIGAAELGIAAGLTILDRVGMSAVLKPAFNSSVKQLLKHESQEAVTEKIAGGLIKGGMTDSVAKQAAVGAVTAAAEGGIATAVQEWGQHEAAGLEVNTTDLYDMMIESALLGGAIGGPAGGVAQAVYNKQKKYAFERVDANAVVNERAEPTTATGRALRKATDFTSNTWNLWTGKVTSTLAPKLTSSEAGQRVHNSFDKVEDTHRQKRAEYNHNLNMVEEQARKDFGRKWKDSLMEDYAGEGTSKSAQMMKAHLDSVADDAVALKLMGEDQRISKYIPAHMDKDRILANWDQFSEEARQQALRKGDDADATVAKVNVQLARYKEGLETGNWSKMSESFERIASDDDLGRADQKLKDLMTGDAETKGRMGRDRVGNQQGNLEQSRLFDADQDFYNRWSKGGNQGRAGWNSVRRYANEAAHRMASAEVWGRNGEKLNRDILQAQSELSKTGKSLTMSDIKRMYDIVDAYDGSYERIQSAGWRGVSTAAKVATNIAVLPLTVLSSLTEPFNIAMKTDMSTMVKSTAIVGASFAKEIARKMVFMGPSDRHLTNATQMSMAGQTLKQANQAIAARLTDPGMSDIGSAINTGFFNITGLTLWTQAVRNISAEAARLQIREDLTTTLNRRESGAGDRATARLRELGITEEQEAFLRQVPMDELERKQQNQIIGNAINKFNRSTALEPSFVDRPLWMSNQKMWMLAQLQGFPTMFTNTVLPMLYGKFKGGVPHNVVDGMFIVAGISLLGGLQQELRAGATGREIEDDYLTTSLMSLEKYLAPKPIGAFMQAIHSNNYGVSPVESAVGVAPGIVTDMMQITQRFAKGDLDTGEFMEEFTFNTIARTFKGWRD